MNVQPEPPRIATYRLQFSPRFRFRDAQAVLPYLRALGVSHVYASPIARPNPGSMHGYDVCDPREHNPELGTRDELLALLRAARDHGLGWVQDVVPNHLAASRHNPFLRDVLRFGQRSRWAFLFDIDWQHPDLAGKVLLPILGEPYARVLAAGTLRLAWDEEPELVYGEHRLPLAPGSVAALLAAGAPTLACELAAAEGEDDPVRRADLLARALGGDPRERATAATILAEVRDPALIDRVVRVQAWQPAWWRTGRELVGYRRFFAVDELIAVRVEDERAFALVHALPAELDALGLIDGLRIDHIDGLRDPAAYLRRLRERFPRAWLLVEKIVAPDERLPASWPVDGTTGYEVANALTGVCCDPAAEARFTALHVRCTGAYRDPTALAVELRRGIDDLGLGGDLDRAVAALRATATATPALRDLGRRTLRDALAALLARFTVYRTYAEAGASADDAARIAEAVTSASADQPALAPAIALLGTLLADGLRPGTDPLVREAVVRVQQLSGPVMAKGWEDAFLYAWTRCLALNEVGGDPRRFGLTPAALLAFAAGRGPDGLNATATHDTKRGEDVRARIAALTWYPKRWEVALSGWFATHAGRSRLVDGAEAPSAEDRHLLYQTLVGTWPGSAALDDTYRERLQACALKSTREAGTRTSWTTPDPSYEESLRTWLAALLDPGLSPAFQRGMDELAALIAPHAGALGLVQTLLKCALPGVPDVYQGAEWHDLSLVDPDNRRPVDFAARAAALAVLPAQGCPGDPRDQRTKQAVLARCLQARRQHPELWRSGSLRPLRVAGDPRGVVAFARVLDAELALVVARVRPDEGSPRTTLLLDEGWARTPWHDVLSDVHHAPAPALPLDQLLAGLPCALLRGRVP